MGAMFEFSVLPGDTWTCRLAEPGIEPTTTEDCACVYLPTSCGASQLPEDPFEIVQVAPGPPEIDGQLFQGQLQQADGKNMYRNNQKVGVHSLLCLTDCFKVQTCFSGYA